MPKKEMKKSWKRMLSLIAIIALTVSSIPMYMGVRTTTAEAATVSNPAGAGTATSGEASNNVSDNNYININRWATTVKSYAEETENSYFRVEAMTDYIVIEEYSLAYELLSKQNLEMELPVFGGYFSGSAYNFIVFGQANLNEDDTVEIMRIVKYDKSWNRLAARSIFGANTYIPFDAGSLRMTEDSENLFIHTCHEMYTSADGYHHQANMTYVLNQSDMNVTQSWYNVMNINYGYVSHSFNQFVKTDGTYLYRVDHGDAYPRAVVLTKAKTESITSCSSKEILPIAGSVGANDTGVAVGGFEIAGSQLIVVGNSVLQDEAAYDAFGHRNIFVTSTNTGLTSTNTTWLTDYTADDGITVYNPHLVKASENELYVLWEEQAADKFITVKVAEINAEGTLQGKIYTIYARLSDCAPIYTSEGEILWYTTANGAPVFYHLSTDNLEEYEFTGKQDSDNPSDGSDSDSDGNGTLGSGSSGNGGGSGSIGAGGNSSGYNNVSNTGSSSVKKPDKVTGVHVRASKKKLVVSWQRKDGVSGYQIQYALNKKFTKNKKSKTVGKGKSSKTLKGLKKGKKYYVRVRAYKKNAGKKVYGQWSKVRNAKVK